MNSFTLGIIIALLIVFLLGILLGYSLVQRRQRQQAEALKIAQRRLAEIEQSHELRLREATDQLRRDYESQLATTIEHYQDQLSQKTIEMEQIYETRFRVLQQGTVPAGVPAMAMASEAAPTRPGVGQSYRGIEAIADDTPQALTQPELMHLKRQYEIRLKEAAQKLQKAYETQLAEHAKATRADIKAEYEQQLAAKYQEFEQEFADRQSALEQEVAELRSQTESLQALLEEETDMATPSQIMGTGDETTVTLAAATPPAEMVTSADPPQYTQSQLDEQVQAATRQAEVEFEQRLAEQMRVTTREAEAEFDKRLTEQLEVQQVQFDRRFRELEAEYKARITELENAAPESVLSPVDQLFGDDNYDDLASNESAPTADEEISALESDLFAEEDFFSTTPTEKSPGNPEGIADPMVELEDDLFADDFFADPPTSKTNDTDENDDDDDDDNFMPLDLSDIS